MSSVYEKIMNAKKKSSPSQQLQESEPDQSRLRVGSREKADQRSQNIFSPADDDQEIRIEKKKNNEEKVAKSKKEGEKKKKPKASKEGTSKKKKSINNSKSKTEEKIEEFHQKPNQNIQQLYEDFQGTKKSTLTLGESLSLSMGYYNNLYQFPIKREIPIIANLEDEERQKYETGAYISEAFDNNFRISFIIFFLRVVLFKHFIRPAHILWLAAVILAYFIPKDAQYTVNKEIMLGIYLFYCFFGIVFQYLVIYKRRSWAENLEDRFRVYHYDNRQGIGEWQQTSPLDFRPGNILKINLNKDSVIPTDCIIMHSKSPLIQVDESAIVQNLSPMEKQERKILKQSLIKDEEVNLPITAVIEYQLFAPEVRQEHIVGQFSIQQPYKAKYNIDYNHIIVRGTKVLASLSEQNSEMLCVVLETGIDSLMLKPAQFPYQYRQSYKQSDIIDIMLIINCILFIAIFSAEIAIGDVYISSTALDRGYYLENFKQSANVTLPKIIMYHYTNFIILIPLLLKVIYLIFIYIQGLIIESRVPVTYRDKHMISEIQETGILVTTLISDLPRPRNLEVDVSKESHPDNSNCEDQNSDRKRRRLHSIKVEELYHNFSTTKINQENYTEDEIDYLGQFMAVSLLSCNHSQAKPLSPLERGIAEECAESFDILANLKNGQKNNYLKVGDFKVIKMLTISASNKYPYKIVFYKHAQEPENNVDIQDMDNVQAENNGEGKQAQHQQLSDQSKKYQKILCLIRGEVSEIVNKFYRKPSKLLGYSEKLHQEKGFHIEMLAKSVLTYQDFHEIEEVFHGNTGVNGQRYAIKDIYKLLEAKLLHTEILGLLIWENPYLPSTRSPPISSLPHPEYKIIIAPQSRFDISPEFHSIHTITNYLLKTFKLPISEVTNKILHQYKTVHQLIQCLLKQKIIVLNGWDINVIRQMLKQLKEYLPHINSQVMPKTKLLSYIEHDEYAWILKETDFSIASEKDGFDLNKYPDVLIKEKQVHEESTSIIRRLFLYSYLIRKSVHSIILTQFRKGIILATVQFIGSFYTWGTGISIISSPLYILLQCILFFDIFYHLVFHAQKSDIIRWKTEEKYEKKMRETKSVAKTLKSSNPTIAQNGFNLVREIIVHFFVSILYGCVIAFLPIYSLTEPIFQEGNVESQQFLRIVIHFIIVHSLIYSKIFYPPYGFSAFKALVLVIQTAIYYGGMLLISEYDTYHMKGIIWYCFSTRIVLTCVFSVWAIVSSQWVWFIMIGIIKSSKKNLEKYEEVEVKQGLLSRSEQDSKLHQPSDQNQ